MAIEVEGPDGSVIEFPDGTSNQVMQRAMGEKFGTPKAAAPKPAKAAVGRPLPKKAAPAGDSLLPADAKRIWDESSARLEAKIAKLPENIKAQARDKFFKSPAIQRLQVASAKPAPAQPAMTTRQRGAAQQKKIREQGIGKYLPGSGFLSAVTAGAQRNMFGVPEMLASAIQAPFSEKSYSELLEENRGATDSDQSRSTVGNVIGSIYGAVGGGNAATKAITSGVTRVAPGVARMVAGAGRVAPRTTKLIGATAGGAAGGAAQALGEGADAKTYAAVGAVGAPVLMGVGKVAKTLGQPAADFLRLTSAGSILKRLTKATREEMETAAATYRSQTGSEPTLFEILPLADRNKLATRVAGSSPTASERTANAVRTRVANIGPELQATARAATAPRRQAINSRLASEMNDVGGTVPANADRSPLGMKDFQAEESRSIMAPHEDTVVADELRSLYPTTLQNNGNGTVEEVFSDPEVNNALVAAAGSLRLRANPNSETAAVAGLTANDATRILRNLAKVDAAAPNKAAALRAEEVLMNHMDARFPEASQAIEQMRRSYARRARMVEGMAEGGRGRTLESVPVEKQAQARTLRNAYETPEGTDGRFLGQANAVERDLGGTTASNLRAATELSESAERQSALRQNLGDAPADRITGAARAQEQSGRNLSVLSKAKKDEADSLSLQDIGKMALALNPQSMPATKLFAISRIASMTHMPESRAIQLVDLLFSQNPRETNRAIGLLNHAGEAGRRALQAIGTGMKTGSFLAGTMGDPTAPTDQAPDAGGLIPSAEASESQPEGLLEQGNIDLHNRPVVQNDDGTISTVRSITVGFDDGTYLLPTVVDGRVVSDEEAIAHFKQTHEHLGKFKDEQSANAYAQKLHEEQDAEYSPPQNGDREFGSYGEVLQDIYENEDPDFLDLWQRQTGQESRRRQFGDDGQPLTSSAGAVGIAQVMPGTAPEAAKLAGLEWDEDAYRHDEAYNEMLGMAYMKEMLRRFDGDVEKALAAYNAGPGAVEKAGGVPNIAETQDYVRKILG